MCIRDSGYVYPLRLQVELLYEFPYVQVEIRLVSVSYTHLDVYKRQGVLYLNLKNGQIEAVNGSKIRIAMVIPMSNIPLGC